MKQLLNRLLLVPSYTLFSTAVLTFSCECGPGDVARVIAGSKASPDVITEIHAKFHLHEPGCGNGWAIYFGDLARRATWAESYV